MAGERSGSTESQDHNFNSADFENEPSKPKSFHASRLKSELSDDIWDQYLDSASQYDEHFLARLSEDLETLLLFAALFSAIVTAFLLESYKGLQPQSGDATVELLQQILYALQENSTNSPAPVSTSFTPSGTATRVNACWFSSLILSLTTAFFAILAKQWILELKRVHQPNGPSIMRGRLHQFYTKNVENWKLYFVITSLPILLHISLLLFLIALVEWLHPINETIAKVAAGLVYLTVAAYVFIHVLSLLTPHCPYRTSVTVFLDLTFKTLHEAWVLFRAWIHAMTALQRIHKVYKSGVSSSMIITDLISSLFSMIFRPFRHSASGWETFAYYWMPRLIPSEVKYILKRSDMVDIHALAWLIDRSSEFGDRVAYSRLAGQVCYFGPRLIPYRALFLERGMDLLVHQLCDIYTVGTTNFGDLEPSSQRLALRYATALARLSTEAAEDEPSTVFSSGGVPYHVDWIQLASLPILSIFSHQVDDKVEFTDSQDLRFFAAMLRLQISSSIHWYWTDIRRSTNRFFELVGREGALQGLSDEYVLVVINTLVYIGTCRVARQDHWPDQDSFRVARHNSVARLYEWLGQASRPTAPEYGRAVELGRFASRNTAQEVDTDNVLIWLLEHTPQTLDALSAVMLNRPDMPFAVRRQICWGIWALSGDRYFIKPLVPTITTTKHLAPHLARYMRESSLFKRPNLAHAVLVLLEGVLYSASVGSTHSKAVNEKAETIALLDQRLLTETLVEQYYQPLRDFAGAVSRASASRWMWVRKLTTRMVRISGFLAFYYYPDYIEPEDLALTPTLTTEEYSPAAAPAELKPAVRVARRTLFMLQSLSAHLLKQEIDYQYSYNWKSILSIVYPAACRLARLQAPGLRPSASPPADFFVFKDYSPQAFADEITDVFAVAQQLDNATLELFLPMVSQLVRASPWRNERGSFFWDVVLLLRDPERMMLLDQSRFDQRGSARSMTVVAALDDVLLALRDWVFEFGQD